MLQPIYDKNRRASVARSVTIPFPWKGLNTRDRLEESSVEYAQLLDNFVVENGEGNLRNGYSEHATGLPVSDVESLLVYSGGGNDELFAAVDGNIYDVTTSGAVGAAAISSLTNNRWIDTMYSTTSGQYLIIANGEDSVRHYDGTNWATPTITGVTSSTLSYVGVHKGRVWFVEKNTMNLWYLATNAVAGAATKFPLGSLCKRGGTLTAFASWSFDSGDGPDDRMVIITSEGEVLIYEGTDPASNYVLVGIFQTDRPVSNKCFCRYGGELIIFTKSGPVPCSELTKARDPKDVTFNQLVRSDFVDLNISYGARYGWEAIEYTQRGWLIFNCAINIGSETAYQYVYNDGAWFRFRYMAALCWAEMGGELYFGAASGGVYKADDPTANGDNGTEIIAEVQWAWSSFKTPMVKQFTQARIHILADVKPEPLVEMRTDYGVEVPSTSPTLTDLDGATWDDAEWDESAWAGSYATFSPWVGINGIGNVGALRMRFSTLAHDILRIQSVQIVFQIGSII